MLWFALVLLAVALVIVVWAQLNLLGNRPAVYMIRSTLAAEPYIRSWGQWLEEHGRVVVRQPLSGEEAEVRKRRYKTRPDVLLFRYRNADANKDTFDEVLARFDAERVAYQLERTRTRQQPRALTVSVHSNDVFAPVVIVRLLSLTLRPSDADLEIFCEGRIRAGTEVPKVKLIPPHEAHRIGYRLGASIGRLWSRFRAA